MSMHSVLMKLPVIERREFIKKIYGFSLNTVKCAIENPMQKEIIYESKILEAYIVFIHSKTLLILMSNMREK